jgi:type II pantothenate kinase
MNAAIDFGITNIDAVAEVNGSLRRWTRPALSAPDPALVRSVLANGGVDIESVRQLAVTGGQHRELPALINHMAVRGVNEIPAIGRGGLALAEMIGEAAREPWMVVSAGSGTAAVFAHGDQYAHITGSAVGGGTLLGLSRLILKTVDPLEIDALAQSGDPNGVDLALSDVIQGPIGRLPPDATAVNFGRLARQDLDASRADLAAALVTLVGQVIAVTAINAARAQKTERVIFIGHLTDMLSIRHAIARVGEFYGLPLTLPPDAGYATALGALRHLEST